MTNPVSCTLSFRLAIQDEAGPEDDDGGSAGLEQYYPNAGNDDHFRVLRDGDAKWCWSAAAGCSSTATPTAAANSHDSGVVATAAAAPTTLD